MFSRLIGNDVTKLTLRRLIHQDRLPNSSLFIGPDGVGKKQFAIETARTLFADNALATRHAAYAHRASVQAHSRRRQARKR